MLDGLWVAQQIGRPVFKASNNILAKSLLDQPSSGGVSLNGRVRLHSIVREGPLL